MLSRKSLLVFINKIISYITGYIGLFFIARFMARPDYNYGIVSFALSFVGLFGVISNFFKQSHRKRISEGKAEGRCMGTYVSLKTLSIFLTLSIIFISLISWKHILGRGFQSPVHEQVIYIILIFFTLKEVGKVGVETFIGKGEIAKVESLRFMDQTVPTIFIVVISLTGGEAIELAYTYVIGGISMALLTILFLKDIKFNKPSWKMIKSYWNFGLPTFISGLARKFGNRVDMILVQLFWSSSNVGLYMAGRRVALIVNGIAGAVSTVLFPTISSHHADLGWKKIRKLVKSATRYISLFVSPIIIFMILFPKEIIYILLSANFLPAAPVIQILGINSFFMVVTSPFRQVLPGINKPQLGAKIAIAGNIMNVVLNILLIPDSIFWIPLMGLKEVGAAIATLAAGVIIALASVFVSRKEAGVEFPRAAFYHLVVAAVTGFLLYNLHRYVLPIERYYHLIFYGLTMLGFYTGILYLLGEFTKQDWDYIMDTINPKEMWYYIRDELTGNDSDRKD